jgi:hypothetical protein
MVLRGISERKRTEERLRESEEKSRLIFDHAPLGIFHFGVNGVVTACNEKFAEIAGVIRYKEITPFKRCPIFRVLSLRGCSALAKGKDDKGCRQ